MTCDCSVDLDPRRLMREGARQDRRGAGIQLPADDTRDATALLVDSRRPEHAMVFASAYARHVRYFGLDDQPDGDWHDFFASDISAQLAAVAVEDVSTYRVKVTEQLRHLKDPAPGTDSAVMMAGLQAVFDCIGTLALRLDTLKEQLPVDQPLRMTLAKLIRAHLSPMLRRLIGYHLAGQAIGVLDPARAPHDATLILGQTIVPFGSIVATGLRADEWPAGSGRIGWPNYVTFAPADLESYKGAYGSINDPARQVNHLATHNLFTAAHEAFLAVYAQTVDVARAAIRASFDSGDHPPHYALFLAFLRLLDHTRTEANGLTARHLDFYYRQVLRLSERPAEMSQAHVLVQLAKHVRTGHPIPSGTKLKAGKDATGADAFFAVDRELVANKASVADIRRLSRHADQTLHADAVDTATAAWAPFSTDGKTTVGFAIASHHLWLAEGDRTITVEIHGLSPERLTCRLTTAKGWLSLSPKVLLLPAAAGMFGNAAERIGHGGAPQGKRLVPSGFVLNLTGSDPPIVPYDRTVHGFDLPTSYPVLIVEPAEGTAPLDLLVNSISITVHVEGLRTLTLSNDHGPIDGSRPFQPYGATPVEGSQFIIGSNEAFQKHLTDLSIKPAWMGTARHSPKNGAAPQVTANYLAKGVWQEFPGPLDNSTHSAPVYTFPLDTSVPALRSEIDFSAGTPYSTASRDGFVRLSLNHGFGFDTYPVYLVGRIAAKDTNPDPPPVAPLAAGVTLDYTAEETIDLGQEPPPAGNHPRFLHLTPFEGHREPARKGAVTLFPRFLTGNKPSAGELYIGIRDLEPRQSIALLVQVVDGTADPLVAKPPDHIEWSFLDGNDWVRFPSDTVADLTDGLLTSGIVTLAVPAEAGTTHTVLPSGLRWIRLAVADATGAVCDLTRVAAQVLKASYLGNDGTAPARELPAGTITRLDPPDAGVKGVSQPFPTFGGRPAETEISFTTRVSERLRHKDRAVTLWDYEHLILERFPGIFQVRCLNHTRYEPDGASGIYRELAAGHVTVVTIPDLPNPHDQLHPYTNLHVLGEIKQFLTSRMSCFVKLHVCNPQFEEVLVDLKVRLRDGRDPAFHTTLLREDITAFLSPWAFGRRGWPTFNGAVHKSTLVNFVEERDYVDYVTDVSLFHRPGGQGTTETKVDETVVGSRAVSVLVSAPAGDHRISLIDPTSETVAEHCACGPEGHP